MRLIWLDGGGWVDARRIAMAIACTTLVPIAIACGSADDASAGTEGTSDGMPTSTEAMTMSAGPGTTPTSDTLGSTTDSTEPSTGGPSDDTGSSSGSTGAPATDGSSSESGSESSSSGEPSETETTTGGIMSQACADGCEVQVECGKQWTSTKECTDWCNANLGFAAEFSQFCMQAWEELSACLATLDCTQYGQWQSPTEFPYPCWAPDDALAFECEGQ